VRDRQAVLRIQGHAFTPVVVSAGRRSTDQQRFRRRPFGKDHVMGMKLQVEVLHDFRHPGGAKRDGASVDEIIHRHQHPIQIESMPPRQV
jgi:hypothetical protein